MADTVRVLIVEDHQLVADAVSEVIGQDSELEVVGVTGTGLDAVDKAGSLQPDVVLMDFVLPDQSGAEAAAAIKRRNPSTAIVFLSADDTPAALVAAINAGASDYLLKTGSSAGLLKALHRAAAGAVLTPPAAWHAEDQGRQLSGNDP